MLDAGHRDDWTHTVPASLQGSRKVGGGEEETDSSPAWVSGPEGGVGLSCALHSLLPPAVVLPGRKPPLGNVHLQGPRDGLSEMCAWEVIGGGGGVCERAPYLPPLPCTPPEQAFPPW